MLGLVYKDIVNMKKTIGTYLLLILFMSVVGCFISLGIYVVALCGFLIIIPPIQSIREDEKSSWNRYGVTMPISRHKIVLSKFVLVFIGALISASIVALNLMFVNDFLGVYTTEIVVFTMIMEGVFAAISMPISLKFGSEYGGGALIVLLYVPGGIYLALQSQGVNLPSISGIMKCLPIAAVVILALSIASSIYIYGKKDF